MALQITANPRAQGSLSITANSRARFSSVVTLDWDAVTGKPPIYNGLDVVAAPGLLALTDTSGSISARTIQQPASGITVANGGGVAGNPILALANDLAALEGLGSTGFATRTAADTWAQRSIQVPAAGLSVTNPGGVAGDPTLALANDLAAVEGLSGTGIAVRTATDAWAQRSIAVPAAGLTITNPAGVAGNPTLALANDLASLEGLATTGIARRTGTDAWSVGTAVVNSELTTMANNTVKGNVSGSTATPSDLTQAQLTALINLATTLLPGTIPALPNDATKFLNGLGAFSTPASAGSAIKAWANFVGSTGSVTDSAGGVTISRNGAGDYTATFPGGLFANANYILFGTVNSNSAANAQGVVNLYATSTAGAGVVKSATTVRFLTANASTGAPADFGQAYVAFVGN